MATSVRAIEAGRAEVRYGLNTEDLPGQMAAMTKQMQAWGRRLQRIGQIGAAAGGAITTAFAAAAKQFASTGDQLEKMSTRTGIGVEALSELSFAAEQSGTDINQLSSAIFRATRRIGNAATGTGPAVRALAELGLVAEDLSRLAPEDQFAILVDELNNVENAARRSQLGFEIFGDNWRQLQPLISQGTEGIAALRQQARELGITMSTEDADAAAALTDAMNELWTQVKAVSFQVGAAIAGPLTDWIRASQAVIASTIDWIKENRGLVATIAAVAAAVTIASTAIVVIGTIMASATAIAAGLATAFSAVAAAVTFLLSPIGLLVAGLVAVVAAFLWLSGAGTAAIDALGAKIKSLGQQATAGLGLDKIGTNLAAAATTAEPAAGARQTPIPIVPTLPPDSAAAMTTASREASETDKATLAELQRQTELQQQLVQGLAGSRLVAGA